MAGFKHSDKTKNKLATIFKGNLNSQNQLTAISVQVLDIETEKQLNIHQPEKLQMHLV